jgi:hypothetical protein
MTGIRLWSDSEPVIIARSVESSSQADFVLAMLGVLAIAALYLLPAFIARHRKHPNVLSIVLLNVLLGWTLLGWVGALIWATSALPAEPTPKGA